MVHPGIADGEPLLLARQGGRLQQRCQEVIRRLVLVWHTQKEPPQLMDLFLIQDPTILLWKVDRYLASKNHLVLWVQLRQTTEVAESTVDPRTHRHLTALAIDQMDLAT
jgi:hypothetical protein